MSVNVGGFIFRYRSMRSTPSFTVTSGIGTRTLSWTAARPSMSIDSNTTSGYAWMQLYDSTSGTVLATEMIPWRLTKADSTSYDFNLAAGSLAVTMPASNATHTIVLRVGYSSTTSSTVTWKNSDGPTYTVTIPGARSFGITYYDYDGGTYLSTTGTEASYHTVNNPGSALRGFTSWNTSSDGTGTIYNPGSTRYVDGNLVFYAMGNPNTYKMNMGCYLGSNQVNAFGQMTYKLGSNYEQEEAFLTRQISQYSDSVNQVGDYAFHHCSALTSINLPQATTIGSHAFEYCYSLASISLPRATTINISAFGYCSALTSINLPQATTIESYAFQNCYSLVSVNLSQATTIGSYAFGYCRSLSSMNLSKVTTIMSYTFTYCYNLLTLSLPGSSVVSLASTNAFYSTPISTYTTSTGGAYGSIYVPASLYNSYITATNWSVYSARIVSIGSGGGGDSNDYPVEPTRTGIFENRPVVYIVADKSEESRSSSTGLTKSQIKDIIPTLGGRLVGDITETAWFSGGTNGMSLLGQQTIKNLYDTYSTNLIVILDANPDGGDYELLDTWAETVTAGDPTYAGPLAGVAMELPVYYMYDSHIVSAVTSNNSYIPNSSGAQYLSIKQTLDVLEYTEDWCTTVDQMRTDYSDQTMILW